MYERRTWSGGWKRFTASKTTTMWKWFMQHYRCCERNLGLLLICSFFNGYYYWVICLFFQNGSWTFLSVQNLIENNQKHKKKSLEEKSQHNSIDFLEFFSPSPVILNQTLWDICISRALEMAATKRLSN